MDRSERGKPDWCRRWTDSVYLSRDQIFDRATDVFVGYVDHTTGLDVGESYTKTATFNVPRGQSGAFYAFVVTDSTGRIAETDEVNNWKLDSDGMQITLAPPADLVMGTITIPTNGVPGQNATITYTVENQGTDPALGSWYDSVYISADDAWDIDDAFFGRLLHSGTVNGGASYTESITAALPGVVPGDYHVIVRSDIRNYIPESDESNNLGASLDRVDIDAQLLELDVPYDDKLAGGQSAFFKIELTAGTTVRFFLDSASENAFNEIYVRQGQMPTRGQFDFSADQPFVSDQEMIIPVEGTGTYYVLAYSSSAPAATDYTLLAEVIPFSLIRVSPGVAGNFGEFTLKIEGAEFSRDTVFQLVDEAGVAFPAVKATVPDSTRAYATFNLTLARLGDYTLQAVRGEETVALDGLFTVERSIGHDVLVSIEGGSAVRPNRAYSFQMFYGNDGGNDTMAPLLYVDSTTNIPIGMKPDALFTGAAMHVLGASPDGPLDILRPGAVASVPIYFRSGSVAAGVGITVRSITSDDATEITEDQWDEIELSIRPTSLADADWAPFWDRLRTRIGGTWGQYVVFLNRLLTDLTVPGEPLHDVRAMIEQIYTENPNYSPTFIVQGSVLDSDTGDALGGVEMLAYRQLGGGLTELAGTTESQADGAFTFSFLPAGIYTIEFEVDHLPDADRNLVPDLDEAGFELVANQDLQDLDLYIIPPQEVNPVTKLDQPQFITDSTGVPHMFWLTNGRVWHAYFDGTDWVQAGEVPDAEARDFSVATAPNLVDGNTPGLILTFEGDGGVNGTNIKYSVGTRQDDGTFAWSLPLNVTDDAIYDSQPLVTVTNSGEVIVVYVKEDEQIQDDSDLYFDRLNVRSEELFVLRQVLEIVDLDAMFDFGEQISTGNFKFGGETKFTAPSFLKKFGSIKFRMLFEGGYSADCTLDVSAGAEVRFGVDVKLPGSTGASNRSYYISGGGSYSGKWQAVGSKGNGRYELLSATGKAALGGAVDFNVPLEQAVSYLPPNLSVPGTLILSAAPVQRLRGGLRRSHSRQGKWKLHVERYQRPAVQLCGSGQRRVFCRGGRRSVRQGQDRQAFHRARRRWRYFQVAVIPLRLVGRNGQMGRHDQDRSVCHHLGFGRGGYHQHRYVWSGKRGWPAAGCDVDLRLRSGRPHWNEQYLLHGDQ